MKNPYATVQRIHTDTTIRLTLETDIELCFIYLQEKSNLRGKHDITGSLDSLQVVKRLSRASSGYWLHSYIIVYLLLEDWKVIDSCVKIRGHTDLIFFFFLFNVKSEINLYCVKPGSYLR